MENSLISPAALREYYPDCQPSGVIQSTKGPNLGLMSRHFGEGEEVAQSDLRGNYSEIFSGSFRPVLAAIAAAAMPQSS